MRSRVLATLVLGLGVVVAGSARADSVGELEVLRRAIEEHRERIDGFESQERGLLETVERIDRAAEALSDDAARARREARAAAARLGELDRQIADLEPRLAATRRALSARAVALYKAGELGPVRALFSAESLPDALGRVQLLRRLVAHDQSLLDRFRSEASALSGARQELAVVSAQRAAAAGRLDSRERDIARERAGRRSVLAKVRANRSRARAALNELESAARALEETLNHLSETTPRVRSEVRGAVLTALRGSLPRPVEAPVVAGFGKVVDPKFGTEILRKGLDFGAAAGTPVRAVAAGEVRFTGWFRGYGKMVILDHGGEYYTVSGHLDRIDVDVGMALEAGQTLGRVGETGSLTGPKLYFELRRGAEALDPADWLRPAG